MKCKHISLILAAATALALTGCSKSEPNTPTAYDANRAAEAAKAAEAARAEAVKAEAARTAEAAKVEAAKVEAAKVEAAKEEAAKVEAARVEAAKVEAARVEAAKVEAAKAEAAKVEAAKVADKTQELIDKAKGLVAENKFADASTVLQQLAGQSLSDDQTKLVDDLKQQIQKALAAKAEGTVSNLLK